MSESKHTPTPTPWSADDGDSDAFGVFDQNGGPVCYLSEKPLQGLGLRLRAEDEANAAFIVRACNSHDELLEALERLACEAHGFLSMAHREFHGNTNMAVMQLRIDEARAAIAKAKGEAS